ncbi:MAG TPA: PAS domain S-box protein [Gemmataceae bacterium]|jgi:PAS domain S-box-containing protein|nr:PAS domain S-box protein [Gemmataceae bacterium]
MTDETKLRALVVEDDADTRANLADILELDGWQVVAAGTVAAALDRDDWPSYAAVILDRRLPDGSADDLLPRIRTLAPQAEAVIVTGHADVAGAVSALRHGAADYILKPIDAGELRARLGRIADNRRVRLELRRQEITLRLVLDTISDGVLVVDAAGTVLLSNPAMERLVGPVRIGAARADWPHRDCAVRPDGDRLPHEELALARALRGETIYDAEELFRRPGQDQSRWVSASAGPMRDAAGRIRGAVVILRDMTERKHAEEALRDVNRQLRDALQALQAQGAELRRAERKYRGIFEQSIEGICQITPDGQIITANPALARMLGYASPEELLAVPRQSWVTHGDGWERFLARALQPGSATERVEAQIERRDGGMIWVAGTLRAVTAGGTLRYLEARIEDVSERKRLEATFFRGQRMQTIGDLAGGIAHDLNTVLAIILTAAGNLELNLPDEERAQVLEELRQSARRGAGIVKQLLTFARGAGATSGPMQPAPVLRDLTSLLKHLLPRSIRIQPEIADDLCPILGDSTQLYQVVMNLAVNARDAMPDGGSLTIAAKNVTVSASAPVPDLKPGSYVRIRVADTGVGIAAEHMEKIFDSFFTTKAPGHGTGLGLATVLGIVRGHGGRVRVESSPDRGSRFDVYWPAHDSSVVTIRRAAVTDVPGGQGELVLVAGSERSFGEFAKATLEAYGYRVLHADFPGEAMALLDRHGKAVRAALIDAGDGWTPVRQAAEAVGAALLARPSGADTLLQSLHEALRTESAEVRS